MTAGVNGDQLELGLQGKVIVVTGGARGIGSAIARACQDEGAIPVVLDREIETEECRQLVSRKTKNDVGLITAELLIPKECSAAINTVIAKFGRIDGVVNNAGHNDKIGLENGSPEEYVASLNRNLVHYYSVAHYALPHLKLSGGAIVNIGSKVAVSGQGGTSGYASAKGGIMALTREWAAELLPYGIRVNTVVPAEVMTPLYKEWLATFSEPEEKLKSILSRIPLAKRMTTAQEIASTVVFLLSAKAGHTTGQHLFVDGGYVHLDRILP